jgi:adenosylmethionine-8-amino-7-oxononanoate aminotransferase
MFEVTAVPFPDTWDGDNGVETREQAALAALDKELSAHGAETAALIIEPLVQGAAGMRMCRPEFLAALAERLSRAGALLIFDEVMTGFGRTGELFACLKAGVTPDIICLSKGLTGGFLPLSLTVCRNAVFDAFLGEGFDQAFTHGHSFTGNPLGCAAALASLDLLLEDETRARMAGIEALHKERMAAIPDHPRIEKRRVSGTIAALDIRCDDPGYKATVGPRLKAYFMERGLLIRPLGNVIYLIPPLCITDGQLHRAYDSIESAMDEVIGKA